MNNKGTALTAFPRTLVILSLMLLIQVLCLSARSHAACPEKSNDQAGQQMQALATDIRYHNQLYYEKARPKISDAEYDRLFARLVQLERCFPALVAADTPTRTVGKAESGGNRTLLHEQPMLSLTSATGPDAVQALLKRVAGSEDVQLLVQPKVDGLPVELRYENGRLVSAATRGDGRIGEDVTGRVRKIQGIPQLLSPPFAAVVVVRGEIYADLRLLKMYESRHSEVKYATPRHVAAGLLKAERPDPEAVAILRLFPFQVVKGAAVDGSSLNSDKAALQLLATWGFPVDLQQSGMVRSLAEVQAAYRTYLATRAQQPFAMDGIVVKVDDLNLRQQLGEGARAPFWAAAWKFPADTALSRVVQIRWKVGRTGRRTPVAELLPTRLGGVQVAQVSLHNAAEIARLDIASGDEVVVALVGDVVPQIIAVAGRVPRIKSPTGASLQRPQPALDACLGDSPACRQQFLARLTHFTSQRGLAIAGLGRGRLEKMVSAGLVVDLPGLFLLTTEQLASLPGFSPKTARRLTMAIRAAAHPDSFRLVTALGVPEVGSKSAQRLSRQFSSLDALLTADEQKLTTLPARDGRAAKTLRSFFQSPGGQVLLIKLKNLGVL